jgi:hypothetical protein
MTLQQIVEKVRRLVPDLSQVEITLDTNRAYSEFCQESRCLIGYVYMDVDAEETVYDLPQTVDVVKNVRLVDALGNTLKTSCAKMDLNHRSVTFTSASGEELAVMPKGAVQIEFQCVLVPDPLSELEERPLIKDQFHDALVAKVLEEHLALAGNFKGALYYQGVWKERLKQAKRYANAEGDATQYVPVKTSL